MMLDTIPRKTLAQLDNALYLFQAGMGKMAAMLNHSLEQVEPSDPYFLDIIRGCESLAKTIEKTVVVAPYLAFRNDFEAVEQVKRWLMGSTQYVGDKRGEMLTMLAEYQQDLITRTERQSNGQMILI